MGDVVTSLIQALSEPKSAPAPGRSILSEWVDTQPANDRIAIINAAIDPAWGHAALYEVLRDAGCPDVSHSTVSLWRKKCGYQR